MGGGVIIPKDGPTGGYGGSLTLSVFMSCLVAASGGLIFGYDIGISAVPEALLAAHPGADGGGAGENEYCVYDSQTLTAFTSSLYVAGLVVSLVASRVTRAMGSWVVPSSSLAPP
ncbi:hypothetical protein PR202_gb15453 [Eleusine coracana subsp. coracana]|uniref:Major facilitator superfamily (MFS) profile domain-containing protein n=1 Tax=Eleusine coracana subsp. coracana TaxID=191504 RepID=A0AAV5EVN1_ELECO|nr:hypothetical protein PR202_gb15453 [Eleusine coracana subsp. coracana]